MFAVVRSGGKQYRVAPGDKIVVEKLDGDAGQRIDITDVLLAGEGSELRSVDGLTVAAEIVAQAKGEKVTVFKKRRRHNYRRKKGHRQQHTILKIVAIGDQKEDSGKKAGAKAAKPAKAAPAEAPVEAAAPAAANAEAPADAAAAPAAATADPNVRGQIDTAETPNPAPEGDAAPKKGARAKKAPPADANDETMSTENAAPAKGAAKKSPKAK
jgi:large subunit ribosomal protein L21